VRLLNEKERKFFREEKKKIIEYYKACKKEQERLLKEKEISPKLDIDRIMADKHRAAERRMALAKFYGRAFAGDFSFGNSQYEIDDLEYIEQIKIDLAKKLIEIEEEEFDLEET